jgi:hypothetical protein
MILVRFVCQAKFNQASKVVAGFKQSSEKILAVAGPNVHTRILTDLSGPFDTVVQEVEFESLAEWERLRGVIFSDPAVQEAEARTVELIDSGRTEYYTIETEWLSGKINDRVFNVSTG